MKAARLLLAWVLVASVSFAAPTPSSPVTLVGLMGLPGYKCAVVSVAGSRPGWLPTEFLMRENERFEGLEMLKIFPERGVVELRLDGSNLVAALPGAATNAPGPAPAATLAGVSVTSALAICGELTGRTLLRHPALPDCSLTLRAFSHDKAEPAKCLSDAMATNGIAVLPDGEKFALGVPKSQLRFIQTRSVDIKPPVPGADESEIFPAGAVVVIGTDFMTVAKFYAQLAGREVNPKNWSRVIPNPGLFFKNQTALTKAEMLYAFDTLFAWCGLKMVPDGEKFLKPVLFIPK